MSHRRVRPLGAAVAALSLVVVASGCAAPTPVSVPPPAPATPASPASSGTPAASSSATPPQEPRSETIQSYVATASGQRVFFGHQSVGFNVMKGLNQLFRANGSGTPEYVDLGKREPVPAGGGFVIRTKIGTNGQAMTKIADFDRLIRGGIADQVDVALFKLCFVDIDSRTDVDAIFRTYRTVLRDLERDYPEVTFVHATVPLETDAAAANVTRTRLNTMLRDQYRKSGRLWDIAALESSDPNGNRVGGKGYQALYAGYASDGAHLNDRGGQLVAADLLRIVAHAAWRAQ